MKPVKKNPTRKSKRAETGFTIVELLIAVLIVSVAMGAVYAIYISTNETYTHQREVAHMQANLRAAMQLIKNDIRNAGREPDPARGRVGIRDVSRFNGDADDPNGYPGITMTTFVDVDQDGDLTDDNAIRAISYRVFDTDGDGRRELRRWDSTAITPAWELVFDGIEDIGFAYAYDSDLDRALERSAVGVGAGPVIWAVHTDGVIGLDTNADNVADGNIDALDDNDGDGLINTFDGGLGMQIPLRDIRAVRIFLLARSRVAYPVFEDNSMYPLGHKILNMAAPANANRNNFRHRLLVSAVALNNHQKVP